MLDRVYILVSLPFYNSSILLLLLGKVCLTILPGKP